MRTIATIFIIALLFNGCKCVGDKAKKALNKTGEVVGEGSSEFVKGVSKGVENALDCELVLSEALKQKGVSFGRYFVTKDSNSSNKNKLTVYLIFGNDFTGSISTRVFDPKGTEYGRASVNMFAKKGEAKYADFVFDARTDVESKSRFVVE